MNLHLAIKSSQVALYMYGEVHVLNTVRVEKKKLKNSYNLTVIMHSG